MFGFLKQPRNMRRPYLKPVVELIRNTDIEVPSEPWKLISVHGIGGLRAVGFFEGTDDLLVISSQGRGLFNCITGEKTSRDYENIFEQDIYNPTKLEALGIGSYSNQKTCVSGIDGGGLPNQTYDGWKVDRFSLEFSFDVLLLSPPDSFGVYGILHDKSHDFNKIYEDSELRAWGFSPTGKTLIIADSSDLFIYGRDIEVTV